MYLKSVFCKTKVATLQTLIFLVSLFCFAGNINAENNFPHRTRPRAIHMKHMLTLKKARQLVISKYYTKNINKVALFANPVLKKSGSVISSWRKPNKIKIKKDSWFFFVDEQPGANWEHKAAYILVDRRTGAAKRIPAMSPPLEILKLRPLNRKATFQLKAIKSNIKILRPKVLIKPPIRILKRKKYAVLLSGGMNSTYNYKRYWNDLKFIYKALKDKYGYTDSEIVVLYANGTHSPNGDLDGNGTNDIDYTATKANLTKVINNIAAFISKNGKFFFYSTNHGGNDAGANKSNLILWGESIKDFEFATLTKKIKCAQAIYVMEQCFSGGMIDDLLKAQNYPCTKPSICVMTAARHDEPSWSCDTEGEYDEYIYHWTSAVYGRTPGGSYVNADTNGDGMVSMAEAHNYAKNKDSCNEHPQIGSCLASACSATLGFPSPIKEDCVGFNPRKTTMKFINNRWKIVDGNHWIFDFGNKRQEAQKALSIIKHYKMNQVCFVGRPHPSFQYLLVNGKAPKGRMRGEDCVCFNLKNIMVKRIRGHWKIVDGNHWIFDFGNKKSEAYKAIRIIKKYGFTCVGYVGRPGPSFIYLRK